MVDLLKQAFLVGVGLAAMTRDRVEQYARELADNAKLSADKGQEFVKEVMGRAEKARSDMEARVQAAVNDALHKTDLATRDDLARLVARVDALEKKLADRS
jgi:polyhydroxyalkanoate synthesis regulator phasin